VEPPGVGHRADDEMNGLGERRGTRQNIVGRARPVMLGAVAGDAGGTSASEKEEPSNG